MHCAALGCYLYMLSVYLCYIGHFISILQLYIITYLINVIYPLDCITLDHIRKYKNNATKLVEVEDKFMGDMKNYALYYIC